MRRESASKIAFSVILVGAVLVVAWWVRHRPSYLLYQAHDQMSQGNQAGVIAEYRRLLQRSNLPAAEEIKLRKALGELYVAAFQESTDIDVLPSGPRVQGDNPFVALAKTEFQRVLELDPTDSNAHYYLGRILWAQHLEAYALEELRKSREFDPKNPAPLRYLAQIHLERGDAALARDEAHQALTLDPSFDEARLILVSCYTDLGDTRTALDEYERLSPAFRAGADAQSQYVLLLMQANRWDTAAAVFEAVPERQRNGRLTLAYGRYLLERRRPREASAAFEQAAALMPRSAWPLAWSAVAFSKNGDCDSAGRVSQLLVEALPRWPWSHWANAWSALCRNNPRNALASLGEALRLSPDFFEALDLQSQLLIEMGHYSELGGLLRPLMDTDRRQTFAYTRLAESLIDQGQAGVALEVAETAVKNDLNNADAFIVLGRVRSALKDRSGALRAFRDAERLNDADARSRAYMASLTLSGSELQRALTTLARESSDPDIWCLLGRESERFGDFGYAVEAYLTAASLKPYLLKAQLGLVSTYTELNQSDNARAALDRAFAINSHHKDVLSWRAKKRTN